MQIGDWVEFQDVVVKQVHAGGSSPTTHTFARKRRGMVIGERRVYDVATGTPPLLTNPRRVLLVAISLHRSYRVFEADAQPATAPRKYRRRFPPPAGVIVLGDHVEFDTIVIKEQTPVGSRPVPQSIGRARRGMVVGERQVYDVAAGAPPALSNRRTALLVAVSMHRCYRVFPTDIRRVAMAASAQAGRRSAIRPSTGVTINLAQGGFMGGRATLTPADLELLVADHINQQMTAQAIFTAYDLTLGLRDANPGLHIPHDAVRAAVHAQMEAIVANQLYERETASFGSSTALRYVPR
jgi:hypothetical protein